MSQAKCAPLVPLRPGDRVGLIGPSGAIRDPAMTPEALAARVAALGFEPVLGQSVGAAHGYLSGSDALRLDDLHRMFADDSIRAVHCVRGGYGVHRLLHRIDCGLLRAHPKPLIGFSDITGLHLAIHARCGFPTLHGPMAASDALLDPFSRAQLLRALLCPDPLGALPLPAGEPAPACLHPGVAEGTLIGGNLSLIAALCGTPFLPPMAGKVLFIEEIREYTYAVDRMLTHLRLAGVFDACAAVVFGGFTRCEPEYPDFGLTLEQVLAEVMIPCGKPAITGLPCGHRCPTLTLPLGVRCRVDAGAGTLTILESLF
ncbi:MAG: LD-carboxypeptidase [Clostridia bacterium]|nr:LD-carboxypeptidase [Clostridia bacterium]